VVRQHPGDLVLILGGAYHFVVNEGPNVAGAINYAQQNWRSPSFYRSCGDEACSCREKNGCKFDWMPGKKQLTLGKKSRVLDLTEQTPTQSVENYKANGQKIPRTRPRQEETLAHKFGISFSHSPTLFFVICQGSL
jgi:hypothetical protein